MHAESDFFGTGSEILEQVEEPSYLGQVVAADPTPKK